MNLPHDVTCRSNLQVYYYTKITANPGNIPWTQFRETDKKWYLEIEFIDTSLGTICNVYCIKITADPGISHGSSSQKVINIRGAWKCMSLASVAVKVHGRLLIYCGRKKHQLGGESTCIHTDFLYCG